METVKRAVPLVLALLAALLAWVVGTTFATAFTFGLVALAGAAWLLLQRPLTRLRIAAATLAIVTLPAAAGAHMWRLATSFEPYGYGNFINQKDLSSLVLPVASEARYDPSDPYGFIVNLDRFGVVHWRGKIVTLAELDVILKNTDNVGPALVRVDYRMPFQHFCWILQALRRDGRAEVRIAASRFADWNFRTEEIQELGATFYPHYWPEGEFSFPLDRKATGSLLRIVPVGSRPGTWGPYRRESDVLIPTGVRYELEGRATSDIAELSRWMENSPPGGIEAGDTVPVKCVVAVLNAVKRAGHPLPALVEPEPPSAEIRELDFLPYPTAD